MCKDMKKNPNSPPNRLPNSPHPLKKVKKSTSQQVNESTSFGGCFGSAWVCYGSEKQNTDLIHLNPFIPIFFS